MRRSLGEQVFSLMSAAIIVLFSATVLLPFLHVAASAMSSNDAILGRRVMFWPVEMTLEPLRQLIVNQAYRTSMINTIFITVAGTALNVVFTATLAYPLSRKSLKGWAFFNFVIVFTMFFSGGMIPTFLIVRSVGILDTYWAYLLPSLVSPFYAILLRNFFASIPRELEESALIDGAGHIRILGAIILPLSMAAIATIGLFYAVGHWNVFLGAIIYITSRRLWTLQMFLREVIAQASMVLESPEFVDQTANVESLKMAAIIVSVLPILTIYPFVQKYFVKGVMIGSVKG